MAPELSPSPSKAPGLILFAMVALWVLPGPLLSVAQYSNIEKYWAAYSTHLLILAIAALGALMFNGFEHLIVFWRASSLSRKATQVCAAYTCTTLAAAAIFFVITVGGVATEYFGSHGESEIAIGIIPSILVYWCIGGITALVTYLGEHA